MKKSILIIDIDSKIPNFALAKIEKYYSDKGYFVYKNAPIARSNRITGSQLLIHSR